jgi:hypothetical protein
MSSNDFDPKEVEVMYEGENSNELNAQLDAMAEMSGGQFLTSSVDKNNELNSRTYRFEDESEGDDFYEIANIAISKHFKMDILTPEQAVQQMYWSSSQAVYHHAEFHLKEPALRFASMMRATYTAYLGHDMFDILVFEMKDEESPYVVIWAFPNESIIEFQDESLEDDDEISGDDYLKYLDQTKPKKKEDLN